MTASTRGQLIVDMRQLEPGKTTRLGVGGLGPRQAKAGRGAHAASSSSKFQPNRGGWDVPAMVMVMVVDSARSPGISGMP